MKLVLIRILAVSVCLSLGSGCLNQQGAGGVSSNKQQAPTLPPSSGASVGTYTNVSTGDPTIALLSSRGVYSAMANMTGVNITFGPGTTPSGPIYPYYRVLESTLPSAGDAADLTFANLMSYYNLGKEFCYQAIAREKLLPAADPGRILYRNVDLSKRPSQFTAAEKDMVLQQFGRRFLGRDLAPNELNLFKSQLQDIQAVAEASATNSTEYYFGTSCITLIASIEALKE